ncbi:MAG: hypothetical protein ACOC33_03495 [bacterium]
MGLIDDKKNVFTTIGAFVSLREERDLPDNSNLFPSINNTDDPVSFLVDVLKVVIGSTALQNLTGELFTSFIDNSEPTLKSAVNKQVIDYNSGDALPSYFTNNGITIEASQIDIYGKIKIDPNSNIGNLSYDKTKPSFDKQLYTAIQNEGTDVQYNNVLINYNSSTDSFTFKPTTGSQSDNIGTWFKNFVNNTTFINKNEFITNILNRIYGSVSKNENKTTEELYNELIIDEQINQVLNGDDSFNVDPKKFNDLRNRAKELSEGIVTYDMGCGLVQVELPLSDLSNTIESISGTTDPLDVGNQISNTVNDSFNQTGNNDVQNENEDAIKDGFFQKIINFLKIELAKILTTTPQIRFLLAISSAFQNNGTPLIGDPQNDLINFKTYIKCVISDAIALLNEFIFNLIVGFLLDLLRPIINKILREKINQYLNVIRSLINI